MVFSCHTVVDHGQHRAIESPGDGAYRRLGYTLTRTSLSPEGIALAHFRKIFKKPVDQR